MRPDLPVSNHHVPITIVACFTSIRHSRFWQVPEFRPLVNSLFVVVAPCRGGLCCSPAILDNQHRTPSPRHSHNQYTAPRRGGRLVANFCYTLARWRWSALTICFIHLRTSWATCLS
ncbi:hypothetical protein IG631_05295 [Alternaria alternata]|nr:hypothetical protein IG631_05295 [Alternaria alternata]